MKKFNFRLQAVLDIRQKELEKKQQEMASIVKILNKQIEELEWLHSRENQVLTSLDEIYNSSSLDVTSISASNLYLAKLGNDVKNQIKIVDNTRHILQLKQLEINEAYKQVKVLEKLKEKQEKEYYKVFEEKAAKEIDDIATSRYKVG